jgi:hypothetical protein
LTTGNKAREKYGLKPLTHPDGTPARFDHLRPQRLAAPVTVYIQQFSAHPLERDSAELYGPPDGYVDAHGVFHKERRGPNDNPVYEVTLRPEDGPYLLPYMARQANGQPWDDDGTYRGAPAELTRTPYYPDGSRIFEEIDRFAIGEHGTGNLLSSKADFDFYRAAPSGGYTKGLPASERTDVGEGDIPPEKLGEDFFVYRPNHLQSSPSTAMLARLTNLVQKALSTGKYQGAIWLEGSPYVEETVYWLNLVIDTAIPIAGNASQRPHGAAANDGDRNIIDSVDYIVSGVWADESGKDVIGGVVIQDQQLFTSRDVQKGDARPGGYVATGGHGGIVGTVGHGPTRITFRPVRRHTHTSAVNLSRLPDSARGVRRVNGTPQVVSVPIKDAQGNLLPTAIPRVSIEKSGRYLDDAPLTGTVSDTGVVARIEKNLEDAPLAGFVAEGNAPYGGVTNALGAALKLAALSGMPVVKVGRGNEGFTPQRPGDIMIAGNNLTATKARLLLMACLMRLGSLPPAKDPANPTKAELDATRARIAEYQTIFDTH